MPKQDNSGWSDHLHVDASVGAQVTVERQPLAPPEGVPPALCELLASCMAFDPDARPIFPEVMTLLEEIRAQL